MPIADKTSGICQRSFAWTLHLFFKPPFSKSIYPTFFRRQIYHFVNTIPNKSNKMSHFIDKRLSFSIFKDLDSFFFRFQNQRNPECRQAKRRKKPNAYTHQKNRYRKNTTTELFVLRNPIKVLLIDRVRNRQTCTTFSTTASKHLASVGSRHS